VLDPEWPIREADIAGCSFGAITGSRASQLVGPYDARLASGERQLNLPSTSQIRINAAIIGPGFAQTLVRIRGRCTSSQGKCAAAGLPATVSS
jgi:hypothetical protein